MPTYTYKCESCGVRFDQYQSFSDDALVICPNVANPHCTKFTNPWGLFSKGKVFTPPITVLHPVRPTPLRRKIPVRRNLKARANQNLKVNPKKKIAKNNAPRLIYRPKLPIWAVFSLISTRVAWIFHPPLYAE